MSAAVAMSIVPARASPAEASPGVRTWWHLSLVFAVLFAVTLGAYFTDERMLNGVSVWSKPLKFQASLALHFATLALLARLLPEALRNARVFTGMVMASTAAGLFEIAWIMTQAARGRASHFNDQTLLEMVMYGLMGIGSLVLVAAPFLMGVWLMRDREWRSDPLLLAVILGLIVSAAGTLIVAGYMSMHGSHWVGDISSDAGGLPLTGWSQQVGDLRVAHFFATHAMQLLPLAGFLLRGAGRRGARRVIVLSAVYAGLIAAVFIQTLLGQPFVPALG